LRRAFRGKRSHAPWHYYHSGIKEGRDCSCGLSDLRRQQAKRLAHAKKLKERAARAAKLARKFKSKRMKKKAINMKERADKEVKAAKGNRAIKDRRKRAIKGGVLSKDRRKRAVFHNGQSYHATNDEKSVFVKECVKNAFGRNRRLKKSYECSSRSNPLPHVRRRVSAADKRDNFWRRRMPKRTHAGFSWTSPPGGGGKSFRKVLAMF